MILKKIYSNTSLNAKHYLDKKVLAKSIYGKFFVRSPLLESNPLYLIDDGSNFFNVSSFRLKKFVKSSQEDLSGSSLFAKEFEYKNKLNKSLEIKSFLVKNNSTKKISLLNSFFSILQLTKKNHLNSLLVINPTKGGFICYSNGVTGFMPRSHATFIFNKTFGRFKQFSSREGYLGNLNFLLDTLNKKKDFLVFRLSNWSGKVTLFPRIKKNKFSNLSRRKKRPFSANINFIFLTKNAVDRNHKNTNYENKKI